MSIPRLNNRAGLDAVGPGGIRAVPHRKPSATICFCGGLAFVALAIGFLEFIDPFFFCQDDALSLELPGLLQACRGFWAGSPASYDPFTFLGDPTRAQGTFYPPLYASYAVARFALGDEHATLETLAAIHLLAGYALTFFTARRMAVGPAFAALAGVTFVLSGPVLVMTRCWHSFGSTAAFIPLFALLTDRLRTGPVDWRWPVVMGLSLGLFYHAGFPQLFVLGCGLMLVHAIGLAACKLVPARRLQWLLPALAWGAALALPVFVRQWRFSREIAENIPGGGEGVGGNLPAMLLPYPLAEGSLPNGWGNVNLQWGGHFYYFGTILLVAFCIAIVKPLCRLPTGHHSGEPPAAAGSSRLTLALAVPAVLAFLMAIGESGGLWWLMGLLPVGLRNNPFRAMPWFVFFACVAGARFLQDVIDRPWRGPSWCRSLTTGRFELAVCTAGLTLVALHLTRIGIAFFVYAFAPYPRLPDELLNLIGPDAAGRQQRIMSFTAMRSADPTYPVALPHNLPCEYGVPATYGYNPLVQCFGRYASCLGRITAQPRQALAAYGVRWLLLHRTVWGGWQHTSPNHLEQVLPFANLLIALGKEPLADRAHELHGLADVLRVIELPDAAPLAFDAAHPADALPLRMTTSGLDIDLDPADAPRRVVANFLFYPDMVATADGRNVTVGEDEWQRIVAEVPAGAATLQIRYRQPVAVGVMLAATAAAIGMGLLHWCRVRCTNA